MDVKQTIIDHIDEIDKKLISTREVNLYAKLIQAKSDALIALSNLQK